MAIGLQRRTLPLLALFACAYYLTGRVGLLFDPVGGAASPVWPPAGIALAAIVLTAHRGVAVAIFVASFAVNTSVGTAPRLAAVMAAGNTLEALLAHAALKHSQTKPNLATLRDVLLLMAIAAIAPLVAATFGSLAVFEGAAPAQWVSAWFAWWLGDTMGIIIVGAPLLVFAHQRLSKEAPLRWKLEAGACALSIVCTNIPIFLFPPAAAASILYMLFPGLMWAAVRFGQRGTCLGLLLTSAIAVTGTALGTGPFVDTTRLGSLMGLQTFLAVLAASLLILGAASEERRAAINLRDEFLSIAAHELKTPLTGLMLAIQTMERALQRGGSEHALQKKTVAARQLTLRLGKLIDDLLDVSRIGSNQMSLSYEEVDLASVTETVVERLREVASASGSALELHLGANTDGLWDRHRLEQVVTNLVSNAVKYGAHRPIHVHVTGDAQYASLVVQDGGIGIASHDLGRIFQRFERAVATTNYGGLGLGLYITHNIVLAHAGSIEVTSHPGQGSVFTVRLPRHANEDRTAN